MAHRIGKFLYFLLASKYSTKNPGGFFLGAERSPNDASDKSLASVSQHIVEVRVWAEVFSEMGCHRKESFSAIEVDKLQVHSFF
jgi:hypothetical protein